MRKKLRTIALCCLLLSGCASVPPPDNVNNICRIFNQYPYWREATARTERRWNVPIAVQMAIMYQESSFVSDAKPPRQHLLGFIPWTRPTSAYGYCQAVDHTWNLYKSVTSNYAANRYDFEDASEFIGWYAMRAKVRAGISPTNAFQLYLAYHEGITNYMNKTYMYKPWLIRVAKKVQWRANLYRTQLARCYW